MVFRVVALGSRGSAAVEGSMFSVYGGATSCVYVMIDDVHIVLDGGSGIMSLPYVMGKGKNIHLLLSHLHIDHISGLFVCPSFFEKTNTLKLYAKRQEDDGIKERFCAVMSEPIWPVGPEAFLTGIEFIDCDNEFYIDDVKVRAMSGSHPGNVTCYRIEKGGKSVVYMTDCEITDENIFLFSDFAKGTDLLLCDGQYTHDEMPNRKGFGHSSWEQAAELAYMCAAKSMGIIHHDPTRTDTRLYEMNKLLQKVYPNGFFVKRNEEKYL